MTGLLRAACATLVGVTLAGCFGGSKSVDDRCNELAEYQESRSGAPLVIPDGLKAPAQVGTYTVPPADSEEPVPGAACLARPPKYFREDPAPAN